MAGKEINWHKGGGKGRLKRIGIVGGMSEGREGNVRGGNRKRG